MEQFEPDVNHLAYASPARVFVCVGIKSWVGRAPCHAWTGEFEILESELVHLRREIEGIARPAPDSPPYPFEVRETRGQTSWADSGEVIRVVLWVSQQASAALIGAGTLQLFQSLTKRERYSHTPVKMTREEAIARAGWVLTAHYGLEAKESMDQVPVDDSNLTLAGEEHSTEPDMWTIYFRDSDQTTYRVTLGHLDGLPSVSEIARVEGKKVPDRRGTECN